MDYLKKSPVDAAYSATVKLHIQDVDYASNMVLFFMIEECRRLAVHPSHRKHTVVGFSIVGT